MAEWYRTINIGGPWAMAANGELPCNELAKIIAEKLKDLPIEENDLEEKRQELIFEFESISVDSDLDPDDFDVVMEELYDWGDILWKSGVPNYRLCWIQK